MWTEIFKVYESGKDKKLCYKTHNGWKTITITKNDRSVVIRDEKEDLAVIDFENVLIDCKSDNLLIQLTCCIIPKDLKNLVDGFLGKEFTIGNQEDPLMNLTIKPSYCYDGTYYSVDIKIKADEFVKATGLNPIYAYCLNEGNKFVNASATWKYPLLKDLMSLINKIPLNEFILRTYLIVTSRPTPIPDNFTASLEDLINAFRSRIDSLLDKYYRKHKAPVFHLDEKLCIAYAFKRAIHFIKGTDYVIFRMNKGRIAGLSVSFEYDYLDYPTKQFRILYSDIFDKAIEFSKNVLNKFKETYPTHAEQIINVIKLSKELSELLDLSS